MSGGHVAAQGYWSHEIKIPGVFVNFLHGKITRHATDIFCIGSDIFIELRKVFEEVIPVNFVIS